MASRAEVQAQFPPVAVALRRGERLHAFWADPLQTLHSSGAEFAEVDPIVLPDIAVFGLRSASAVAHLS
eukprot:5533753-Alexandrium_andersonii.AAC.1